MNKITKKRTVSPRPQPPKKPTGAFKLPSGSREHKRSVAPTPSNLVKPSNGMTSSATTLKRQEEFRLYEQLKDELGDFFLHPGLWLEAPHEMLGGRTPLEIARSSSEGKEIVLGLIQAMKAGSYY